MSTEPPSTSSTGPAKVPPGQSPMGAIPIGAVALYLVVISIVVLYGLLKLWPHPTPSGEPRTDVTAAASPSPGASVSPAASPSPGATALAVASPLPLASPSPVAIPTPSPASNGRTRLPDPERVYFFWGRFSANIYAETRLLLIVMLAGALGSLMHSLRSLYWYTGNREMVWSWAAFYMLLPLTGSILAVIFYFVVRGGFFSPQASFENTSPFGFAALSALVGLFSPQATLKLKEVAETIFSKPAPGKNAEVQETRK